MNINDHKYASIIQSIANKIALDAVWYEDICNWIDYSVEGNNIAKNSLGSDVYSGTSGIALFLLKKETLLPDDIHNKTRQGTLRHILNTIDINDSSLNYYRSNLGKYTALLSNAEFDQYEIVIQNTEKAISEVIENCLLQPFNLVILDGISGAITPLLQIRKNIIAPELEELLEEILEEILHVTLKITKEDTFLKKSIAANPIGFGYSIMGSLSQFLKLAYALEDRQAIEHLTTLIKKEIRITKSIWMNWRSSPFITDLLNHSHPKYLGWEDGWTGMAQSRLEIMKLDPQFAEEALDALDFLMALSNGIIQTEHWASNYSIANGLAGIGRMMIEAYYATGETRFLNHAQYIGDSGHDRFHKIDLSWPSGILSPIGQSYISTYGLMNGISGTGMFYIELLQALETQPK